MPRSILDTIALLAPPRVREVAAGQGLTLAASYRAEEGRSLAAKLLLVSRASQGCRQVRVAVNFASQ